MSARPAQVWLARAGAGGWLNSFASGTWTEVSPGRPYAVPLVADGHFRTLALDFDASRGDARRDAARVARRLAEAGIQFVCARSGPSGGRHLIATFTGDGLSASLVRRLVDALHALAPSLDRSPMTNASTGLLRPPGSPHRNGGRSTLLLPRADALMLLRVGNPDTAAERLAQMLGVDQSALVLGFLASAAVPRLRRPLNPRIVRLMRDGDVVCRFRSRSEMAFAVALGMVNAGHAPHDFVVAATATCAPGLEHCRTAPDGTQRSPAQALALCGRLWAAAEQYVVCSPARAVARNAAATALASSVAAAADAVPAQWGGPGGPSARAVLNAVLSLTSRSGKTAVSAGQRQLGEMSCVSKTTAGTAVRRLLDSGWLIIVRPAEGVLGATYELRIPAWLTRSGAAGQRWTVRPGSPASAGTASSAVGHASCPPPPGCDTDLPLALHPEGAGGGTGIQIPPDAPQVDAGLVLIEHDVLLQCHDVFRRHGGLGGHGARLLAVLARGAATAGELVAATASDPRTVRKYLTLLADLQLVRVDSEQRWAACHTAEKLSNAASVVGTAGRGERQREEHRLEQLMYRWYVADVRASHGWAFERGRWVEGWLYVEPAAARVGQAVAAGDAASVGREVAVAAPLRRFPRRADGRHDWAAADRLVRDGECPVLPGDAAACGVEPQHEGRRWRALRALRSRARRPLRAGDAVRGDDAHASGADGSGAAGAGEHVGD